MYLHESTRRNTNEESLPGKVKRLQVFHFFIASWPNGVILLADQLQNKALPIDVLALVVELDTRPRHDDLVGVKIGIDQRLANRVGLGRPGTVDGIGQHQQALQRPRAIAVQDRKSKRLNSSH